MKYTILKQKLNSKYNIKVNVTAPKIKIVKCTVLYWAEGFKIQSGIAWFRRKLSNPTIGKSQDSRLPLSENRVYTGYNNNKMSLIKQLRKTCEIQQLSLQLNY